jgi:hypothetical protein
LTSRGISDVRTRDVDVDGGGSEARLEVLWTWHNLRLRRTRSIGTGFWPHRVVVEGGERLQDCYPGDVRKVEVGQTAAQWSGPIKPSERGKESLNWALRLCKLPKII